MSSCKICKNNFLKNYLDKLETTKINETNNDINNTNNKINNINKLGLSVTSLDPSGNSYIDSLSWGGTKWNWTQGDTTKLSYYFGPETSVANCPDGITYLNGSAISTSNWTEAEKNAMIRGLTLWTNLIGMDIEEVYNVTQADLKFYITTNTSVGYLGAQIGPHSSPYEGYGIYVRNSGDTWTTSLNPGGYGFITIIHELGHGMGLAHPHDNGGGSTLFPGVSSSYDTGDNDLNQNMYTVMSYIDVSSGNNPTTAKSYGFSKGPMALDIATINYLYGLNTTFNGGNNVYTITDTNVNNTTGFTCVYDTGGNDLVVYNGSKKVTIDLRPATIQNEQGGGGYISKINDDNIYVGYTISNGSVIENASGGTNDDTFYQVETVENIINGKDGVDTVYYNGNYVDYTVVDLSESGDGTYVTVTKSSVQDILYNIEKLTFNDQTIFTTNLTSTPDFIKYFKNISNSLPFVFNYILVNHNWITVNLNNSFVNPVVITSDSTYFGSDPVSIRIRNITSNSFQIKLQEPNYLDDIHTYEMIYYIVGEKGSWLLPYTDTPCYVQFGTSNINKLSSQGFDTINMTEFSSIPNLLTQIQTYNGADWVITRTNNITTTTFDITMQEEEFNNNGLHTTEIIGWMAITKGILINDTITLESNTIDNVDENFKTINFSNTFDNNPILLTKLISYNGVDTTNTRIKNISGTSFDIMACEEKSKDNEINHIDETIGYISVKYNTDIAIIYGSILIDHNWTKININRTFTNPIIIVSDVTYNGSDSVTTRIKNITSNSFEIKLQEPNNGKHTYEKIFFMIGESGTINLSDDFIVQFGSLNTNKLSSNGFETINTTTFSTTPNVLTQIQTYNGTDWAITRTNNISTTSFDLTMQEKESNNNGGHVTEKIGWMAISRGTYINNNLFIESGYCDNVKHYFKKVYFENLFITSPNLFVKMMSFNGSDPSNLRITNIYNSNFYVKVQEDQSKDKEIIHIGERIGFIGVM